MNDAKQYDVLTGLPERQYLWSLLEDTQKRILRFGSHAGILLIQIDGVDKIKADMGDQAADELISLMAMRVQNCLWDLDAAVRFSDDQFVIVASSIQKQEDVHVVMSKVRDYLSVDCEVAGTTLIPTTSMGIVLLPYDTTEVDEIMANSQTALQMARLQTGNSFCYFNQELGESIAEQERVKASILSTLAQESFVLMLQPKINTETREICGIEALVRMRDSEGNIVTPGEFIPVAENSNLILKIGDWVLAKAQSLNSDLKAKGINLPISVNISDVQFKNSAALLSTLHKLAAQEDAGNADIILEISENTITSDVELSSALMAEIKSCGYQISIDGFGSGFSSLSVLKDLAIDEIKVDRHFLQDVPSDDKNTAILKSIIMLGKAMNFRVVVIGVEREEQFNVLKEHQCDEFQGFLVSEPLEVAAFIDWHGNYSA